MYEPSFPFNTTLDYYTDGNKFDNIDRFANLASFPVVGVVEKIYYAIDTGTSYLWNGSSYVIYNNPASGVVLSVTGGTDITNSGTAQNPILNVDNVFNRKANNLSDVANVATSRTNLDVYSKLEVDNAIGAIDLTPYMQKANNLSDVANVATSRTNLGLGTTQTPNFNEVQLTTTTPSTNNMATSKLYVDTAIGAIDLTSYMQKANNLSDVANVATSRTNLSVYSKAEIDARVLDNLADVDNTGKVVGDTIIYDGTQYKNGTTISTQDISTNVQFNTPFNLDNPNDNSTFASVGTKNGTVTSITGKNGQGYDFIGNNSWIDYGYLSRFNWTVYSAFTICLWLKTSLTGTAEYMILSQGTGAGGDGWYFIIANPNQNRLEIQFNDSASARKLIVRWDNITGLTNGQWHFITLSKEAGITIDKFKLFFDNVDMDAIKTLASSSLLITDNIQTAITTPFNIGKRNNGGGNGLQSQLDSVTIYNFKLLPSMINSLWNNGLGIENSYVVVNSRQHDHSISEIRTLETKLNTIDTNIANNTTAINSKVASVTSGNSSIIIGGTATNPTISSSQELTTTSSPQFTGITLTNGTKSAVPTVANDIVNKAYSDTKVASVSSANTNLLSISGTSTAPILKNEVGTHQPPVLRMNSFPPIGADRIAVNSIGSLTSTTQLGIGKQPYNRNSATANDEYFDQLLNSLSNNNLPCRIRVIDTANPAISTEFNVHTRNAETGTYIEFAVTYISGSTSFTVDNFFKIIIINKQRTIASGTNINVVESANKETITINTTGVATTSDLTTHTGDTTIHFTQANINPNNITNIERITRNLTTKCNMQVYTFGASHFVPNSVTFTANESMNVKLNTGTIVANILCSFKGHGYPQKMTHHLNPFRETMYAIKLIGSNWNSAELGNCRIGWATEQWFENVEANITDAASLFALTWNTGTSSANKGYTTSFFGTNGYLIYNGSSNVVTRGGYTTDSIANQNDILITTYDHQFNNVVTYWYRGITQRSVLFGNIPSGASYSQSNFVSSNIIPVFTPANSGDNWEFQVMSERDLTADGITFSTRTNYFY